MLVDLHKFQAMPKWWTLKKTEWNIPETCLSSVQSLSRVRLFVTPWTAACQASLSITNSQSPPKPMMPSNHLFLCHPLLLLPSIFPSIRVFSSESAPPIRWPKYWSFSFNISPSSEHPGLIFFRMDWLDLLAVQNHTILLGNMCLAYYTLIISCFHKHCCKKSSKGDIL